MSQAARSPRSQAAPHVLHPSTGSPRGSVTRAGVPAWSLQQAGISRGRHAQSHAADHVCVLLDALQVCSRSCCRSCASRCATSVCARPCCRSCATGCATSVLKSHVVVVGLHPQLWPATAWVPLRVTCLEMPVADEQSSRRSDTDGNYSGESKPPSGASACFSPARFPCPATPATASMSVTQSLQSASTPDLEMSTAEKAREPSLTSS